jgi:hypothetical protein
MSISRTCPQTHGQITAPDDSLGVLRRPAHDGVDAGDQFILVERLCQVVVCAKAEPLDLAVGDCEPRDDEDRVVTREARRLRSTS